MVAHIQDGSSVKNHAKYTTANCELYMSTGERDADIIANLGGWSMGKQSAVGVIGVRGQWPKETISGAYCSPIPVLD